jgi:hypothetical protein
MDNDGRIFARGRLEVGGRREGEAVFKDKERPIGLLRVGGRNEGERPSLDIAPAAIVLEVQRFIRSYP